MIAFILGSMFGGCIGVITMALIIGGKSNEYIKKYEQKEDEQNEQNHKDN